MPWKFHLDLLVTIYMVWQFTKQILDRNSWQRLHRACEEATCSCVCKYWHTNIEVPVKWKRQDNQYLRDRLRRRVRLQLPRWNASCRIRETMRSDRNFWFPTCGPKIYQQSISLGDIDYPDKIGRYVSIWEVHPSIWPSTDAWCRPVCGRCTNWEILTISVNHAPAVWESDKKATSATVVNNRCMVLYSWTTTTLRVTSRKIKTRRGMMTHSFQR